MKRVNEQYKMRYLAGLIKEADMNVRDKIQVWFDLDGVLADMQNSLEKEQKYIELKNQLDNMIEQKFPDWTNLSNDDLKLAINDGLKGDPTNLELKALKKAYRNYNDYIFKIASRPNFYFTMDLMPGATGLIQEAYRITGRKPNILSSPVGNEKDKKNPSVIEKKRWVYKNFESQLIYLAQKYFGDIIGRLVHKLFGNTIGKIEITSDKGRVVRGKYDILIDDRQKYVDKFIEAGGSAILYTDTESATESLRRLYDDLVSGIK